jgi:AcrR family transcriptional regulator
MAMKSGARAGSLAKAGATVRPLRRTGDDLAAPADIRGAASRLKRDSIVAAAVDLFYHQGYARTTLEQVADAINVTKPAIYLHFKSKAELLADICSRAIRLSHDSLNRAVMMDGTPTEKLERIACEFMATVLSHQAHAMIYSREETELTPEARESINKLRREFDRRLVEVIEAGVAAGEFTVEDVPLAALCIGGIVGWGPVWFRSNGRLTLAEVAEGAAQLVLNMVRARAPRRKSPAANR